MSTIGIVTDSTNCLPAELIEEYDIRVVSVGFSFDGKAYRDKDITNDEFWRLFHEAKGMPTTSAASPGDFASAFTELGKSADSIVCMVLSRALSATHEAATQAREMVKAEQPGLNIEIIDSKTSAGALGFIVLEAARAAKAGKSLTEIVQVAQDMIPRAKFFVALDTLKYLIKIGRAPKKAVIGNLLQVKPIIGMVTGSGLVDSVGRARGKRKAMLKMVEMVHDYVDADKPLHIMTHYTDHPEDGDELKDMVTSQFECAELYITPYSPVMASGASPAVAVSFYC
ncbi:DegV family protein [Chloroflexota bacterium]